MLRFSILITLIALIGSPAVAQTSLRPGQTIQGELTTSDPVLVDGSHYDCFSVQTRRGQTLQIDQASSAFDSFLQTGSGSCTSLTNLISDDDSGGGLNSRLVHVGDGGVLIIRVNSVAAAKTGAYRLSVAEISGGATTQGNRPMPAEAPPAAPSQGAATLAEASCQRMGEVIVATHERFAFHNERSVSMGNQSNPQIVRLQPRINTVAAWLTANGLKQRNATRADGILYSTPVTETLVEFERRCLR
jgi:hypothetical protein